MRGWKWRSKLPVIVNARTLFARTQQFAMRAYGQIFGAGLAWWSGGAGNFWGHNAILRVEAFAAHAGLPVLPGHGPLGGHILSHDFVEAVLLQRAGWGVYMAASARGSYEGTPPSLIDHVVRDRRWAQGNLQHLAIVRLARLTPMGRAHLLMGAMSYLVSAIWALSLLVGLVLALQGEHLIPSYFADSRTLFPIWPVFDAGAALRLFVATMAVVLLPKALGLALELKRVRETAEPGGTLRAVAGVAVETVFSMLFAPILLFALYVQFHGDYGAGGGFQAGGKDEIAIDCGGSRRHQQDQPDAAGSDRGNGLWPHAFGCNRAVDGELADIITVRPQNRRKIEGQPFASEVDDGFASFGQGGGD